MDKEATLPDGRLDAMELPIGMAALIKKAAITSGKYWVAIRENGFIRFIGLGRSV
jgi:hypothetical protein